MKFKSIGAICKSRKSFFLFDTTTPDGDVKQWLGDGGGAYALCNFPYLYEDTIYRLFDINEKQQQSILFRHDTQPLHLNFEDVDKTEYPVGMETVHIGYMGDDYIPVKTREGIIFINSCHLKPLEDISNHIDFYERVTPGGTTYIAVKMGFLLVAIIMEACLQDKELVEMLETVSNRCRLIYDLTEKKKAELESASEVGESA